LNSMECVECVECREGCGACCIAPSITSFIPGMPNGKPANMPCIQLTSDFQCKIFDDPARPKVCAELTPTSDICGSDREHAMFLIHTLESLTA